MEIRGKVVSGLGEGQDYVKKYLPYFEQTLGFTCYPGTLNIEVEKVPSFNDYKKLPIVPKEQEFVQVDCYLVRINDFYDGAIVIPHKTRHGKEIIEIVAPVDLRERLHLKDGDEIKCELE